MVLSDKNDSILLILKSDTAPVAKTSQVLETAEVLDRFMIFIQQP